MRLLLSALVCGLLWGASATAQDGRRMLTAAEAEDWQAVGRVNIQGDKFCTGALIAPDRVLTAAHCVFNDVSNRLVQADEIHFLAGYRLGEYHAHRRVRRVMVHRDYDPLLPSSESQIVADIAVLQLEAPINSVRPFERELRPRAGDSIAIVSYARDRPEAPSIQRPCETLRVQDRFVVMDCDVTFGASGSPVFSFRNGRPRITSVVSSIGRRFGSDVQEAYGAALDDGALDSVLYDIARGGSERVIRRPGAGSIASQLGRE
ncbi:trypsin-like serine peptidase [Pontivivens insulae]|uniref:Peptidase S1 domain-containing protein n=1 Tax=Pontivivens insulae TaxID=1639689 RepID=A0A2R8AFN0_9RHOB|nr:trypsin-like serine protease [Pontivivens insulae]RED12272.1 V8-like Glu-specific endopeptidase [Pontivivens insulae]SPF31029.1 hypothetical protein POI8812_03379 [Pontivivens insulae]